MIAVAWVVAVAVAVYAIRIVIATFRNAPVRDDFDTSSCPPVDLDTEMRRLLDDRATWPDAS